MPALNVTTVSEYSSEDVVNSYATRSQLQRPEARILEQLAPKLRNASMLDIGVGGGRTTVHFAPLVDHYVGIDYSQEMVDACRSRFNGEHDHTSFAQCDARDLSRFGDATFDFVLFSYNGVDYIDHTGRLEALAEIERVLKPNGVLCFSTHNTGSIRKLFELKYQLSLQPRSLVENLGRWLGLRWRYSRAKLTELKDAEHCVFFDGYRDTYYVDPLEQLRQLEPGFTGTTVYSLDSGDEYAVSDLPAATDYWLYFLCSKR